MTENFIRELIKKIISKYIESSKKYGHDIATNGFEAYDGWLQVSSITTEYNDIFEDLKKVDRDEFAKEWEDLIWGNNNEDYDLGLLDCNIW